MEIQSSKDLLFILPPGGFNAEEFRTTRASLRRRGVNGKVASLSKDKIEGGVDYYIPDLTLEEAAGQDYDAVVFLGGEGTEKLFDNATAHEIARKTLKRGGIVGAIGTSVMVLAQAGLLRGIRVTGNPDCKMEIKRLGGRYSGSQVEPRWLKKNASRIVTAVDSGASLRFGSRIARDLFS